MIKPIIAYEIIDHGVEHEQYFQGCGVALTKFDAVYTGALEQLACSGEYDLDSRCGELSAELVNLSDKSSVPHGALECWHYVSIRVK